MIKHFNSLTPIDMIFKTDIEGVLTPVRFRIGIPNEGNQVCNITYYREIEQKIEATTADGVYIGRNIASFEVEFMTEYGTTHKARLYYFKEDTLWGISRLIS